MSRTGGFDLSKLKQAASQPEAPALTVANLLAQVRGEVASMIRSVASQEKDARVVGRLYEVAALVNQELSHAEAVEALSSAPFVRERPAWFPSPQVVDSPKERR